MKNLNLVSSLKEKISKKRIIVLSLILLLSGIGYFAMSIGAVPDLGFAFLGNDTSSNSTDEVKFSMRGKLIEVGIGQQEIPNSQFSIVQGNNCSGEILATPTTDERAYFNVEFTAERNSVIVFCKGDSHSQIHSTYYYKTFTESSILITEAIQLDVYNFEEITSGD